MNWHSDKEKAEEKWIIIRCTYLTHVQYITQSPVNIHIDLRGNINQETLGYGKGWKIDWAYIEEPERSCETCKKRSIPRTINGKPAAKFYGDSECRDFCKYWCGEYHRDNWEPKEGA